MSIYSQLKCAFIYRGKGGKEFPCSFSKINTLEIKGNKLRKPGSRSTSQQYGGERTFL